MKTLKLVLAVVALYVAGFAGYLFLANKTNLLNEFYKPQNKLEATVQTVQEVAQEVLAVATQRVEYKTAPASFSLSPSKWIPQTYNNCGPAATAMVLQHFGHNLSQAETKAKLRSGDDDKNIFMYEISDYLRKDFGIESKILINGNDEVIKTLIANGIYVMVEDWMHPNEDIGHVLILRGYDDIEGVFIGDDSFIGVGVKYPYEEFNETQWKVFNREYMPVYTRENEELVKAIIGENWNEKTMYQNSVIKNQKDTEINPDDMYAWFNLGTSHFYLGNYQEAKVAFENSRSLGWPARMLWYQIEPIQNYNKLGEYQKAIELSNISLAGNQTFTEVQEEKAFAIKALESLSN